MFTTPDNARRHLPLRIQSALCVNSPLEYIQPSRYISDTLTTIT